MRRTPLCRSFVFYWTQSLSHQADHSGEQLTDTIPAKNCTRVKPENGCDCE